MRIKCCFLRQQEAHRLPTDWPALYVTGRRSVVCDQWDISSIDMYDKLKRFGNIPSGMWGNSEAAVY